MELFTIALITYQQRHRLEQCLGHIFRQDYKAVELIVCDDNSCDFDAGEVEAYICEHKSCRIRSVTVYRQPVYRGKAACCQTALSLAHGTYMMFLSVDQHLYGRKALSRIAGCFGQGEGSVLVSRSLAFWEDGTQTGDFCPPDADIRWLREATPEWLFVQFGTHPVQPSVCDAPVCFRREMLVRTGFDNSYPSIPFWPLWLRICKAKEKIVVMDEVTVHRCIYQVGDDLGYIAFGMKDRHYEDCIRMLRQYALPGMADYSVMDRVRLRHAAAVLEMAMDERKWYSWRLGKRLLWKIKKAPVLWMGRFYCMRTGNFYISTQKEFRLLLIFALLYYLEIPLAADGAYDFLWAAAASAVFAWLAVKAGVRLFAGVLKTVLDKRADRREI